MSEKTISKESIKQPFWAMKEEGALVALGSNIEGLAEEEVKKRLKIFGENTITEYKRLGKLKIVLRQLASPLILALLFAASITIFLKEWINAGVILGAVLVNSALGFWQENKAESVLEILKSYIRVRTRVRRGGEEHEIDASELVPGDIIRVNHGSRVPGDARIISSNNLEIDEAILTGESLPEEKSSEAVSISTAITDRKSMLFGGTLVVKGSGDAVITATGKETEFGRIAELSSAVAADGAKTPLQKAISDFALRSGLALAALSLILFFTGVFYGYDIYHMFVIAVAVAVSAVPEGLPIALTVILAIGVERLAKKNGVVRKLLAAETLGSTTVILTDKTGTLTEAKMKLESILPFQETSEKEILEEALANTDAIIENPKEDPASWKIIGNPIEVALIKAASLLNIFPKKLKILEKFPFSHETKFSATIYQIGHAKKTAIFGAPEEVLEKTSLDKRAKEEILGIVSKNAYEGARVIAMASGVGEHFENLKFLGLLLFRDPLRPGVASAIKNIGRTGVKTVIVTGDHPGTAEYIARELGLLDGQPAGGGAVMTSEDIAHLSAEELKNQKDKISVFARATPEDKLRLVQLFKESGEVVAVTGDGVNDAPALHVADIGIAVGSGTDVAKNAADLVILDDNFETIVVAIEEGRRIMDNIRKVVVYLLSDSLDELCLIGGALLMGLALPLNALQILFVNFFSDSFPAIALAFEKGVDGLVDKKNNGGREIFNKQVKFLILVIGVLTSILLFLIYFWLLKNSFPENLVRTFIFASFATYTLFLSFSVRSFERSIFSYNPFGNAYLVAGATVGLLLTSTVIYLPPLQSIFGTVPLPALWSLAVLAIGLLNILLVELAKWLFRKGLL